MIEPSVSKRLVTTGIVAGLAISVFYPLPHLVKLPAFLDTVLFLSLGPLFVVAFIGLWPFMVKPRITVAAIVATVFGVLAGLARLLFSAVQLTNLHYIRQHIRAATDPAVKEMWRNILDGVFTVQNGMNYTSDLFVDWTALLYAWLMWRHPKFGPVFSILGLIAAGAHFGLKLYTFPVPPREAGLFDAGPLISAFFALVTIQVLRKRAWLTEETDQRAAAASR